MDNSRLTIRRFIDYDPSAKDFVMTVNFGGFVMACPKHFDNYLQAEDYYNRMIATMEAIFKNLDEASKITFRALAGDTGKVNPITLEVTYDTENDIQSDEASPSDYNDVTPEQWAAYEQAQGSAAPDEMDEVVASWGRGDYKHESDHEHGMANAEHDASVELDDEPDGNDEPYEPYERIREPYDPIRYE